MKGLEIVISGEYVSYDINGPIYGYSVRLETGKLTPPHLLDITVQKIEGKYVVSKFQMNSSSKTIIAVGENEDEAHELAYLEAQTTAKKYMAEIPSSTIRVEIKEEYPNKYHGK